MQRQRPSSKSRTRRIRRYDSFLPWVRAAHADRLETWEAWESVSNSAQGKPKQRTLKEGTTALRKPEEVCGGFASQVQVVRYIS